MIKKRRKNWNSTNNIVADEAHILNKHLWAHFLKCFFYIFSQMVNNNFWMKEPQPFESLSLSLYVWMHVSCDNITHKVFTYWRVGWWYYISWVVHFKYIIFFIQEFLFIRGLLVKIFLGHLIAIFHTNIYISIACTFNL